MAPRRMSGPGECSPTWLPSSGLPVDHPVRPLTRRPQRRTDRQGLAHALSRQTRAPSWARAARRTLGHFATPASAYQLRLAGRWVTWRRPAWSGPSRDDYTAGRIVSCLLAGDGARPRSWRRSGRAPGPARRRCDSAGRPDARLEDLGEWLGERVERPHRGPSGTHEGTRDLERPPTGSSPKNIRSTATCAPSRAVVSEGASGYGAVMSAVQARPDRWRRSHPPTLVESRSTAARSRSGTCRSSS